MVLATRDSNDDLLVSADVLGSFGVTPTDIGRAASGDDTLEAALADAFATSVDRTAVLRRTITRSDRGLACAARYSRAALERELAAVFEAIGWSLAGSVTRTGIELTATDPRGRRREATVAYPDTPLATDNLPAVLWAINDEILARTDARFVLLSSGVDRWRAALVDAGELERLRDRYGPRIEAFDRPLLPTHGLEAYVPAAGDDPTASGDDDPWPPWALEGNARRAANSPATVDSLIDEAEPSTEREPEPNSEPATTSTPSREVDGFELRGRPSVARRRDEDDSDDDDGCRSPERDCATPDADDAGGAAGSSRPERATSDNGDGDGDGDATKADEFGTLSGGCETARVTNDAFGADLECRSDDDRYRALGAALDAGGAVSVRGLLEDDDFLPELPAVGSEETRIEFADGCAPVDIPDATAAAERSGFEWVDAGSLETTRVSEG
ncbi:hypothetical protein [Natrinema salaciae]|uniref:Uncharacterized protein n=1 Tax=Natrinema salaciae TaxID=1186196 RepID=A0A1H9I529_9EURY|nr:hypothetical protein [Natrinema salaciae]SEQ69694.1 hypothetical protein SAMN04489841_2113 [Natrinema salaciae]